jgi:hypothetical protein
MAGAVTRVAAVSPGQASNLKRAAQRESMKASPGLTPGRGPKVLYRVVSRTAHFRYIKSRISSTIIAVILILLSGTVLFLYTYPRWGNAQVDCARDLYVAMQIARGHLLYRDIWYPYGPLGAYIDAGAVSLFGFHMSVFYLIGLSSCLMSSFLGYLIARKFMSFFGAVICSTFLLFQGFNVSIFNFIWPYSYAASFGMTFAFGSFLCVLLAVERDQSQYLAAGSFCAGLALATKPEIGVAAYFVILASMLLRTLSQRSFAGLRRNIAASSCGLVIPALIYGYFFWRLSIGFILFHNFLMIPGSYFMRTFGPHWLEAVGMRFLPSELLKILALDMAVLLFWFLFGMVSGLIRVIPAWQRLLFESMVLAVVSFLTFAARLVIGDLVRSCINQIVFPSGAVLLGILLILIAGIDGFRADINPGWQKRCLLATFAVILGIRVLAFINARGFAIFYDWPVFVVYLILVGEVVERGAVTASGGCPTYVARVALGLELVLMIWVLMPGGVARLYEFRSNIGTIAVKEDEAKIVPDIVSFMQRQRDAGRRVEVLPEMPLLYVATGLAASTRWYEVLPGILDPEEEREYVRQLSARMPDVVILTNRSTYEYRAPYFGIDYAQGVLSWIRENYRVGGEFGRFGRGPDADFGALVYFKKQKFAALQAGLNR